PAGAPGGAGGSRPDRRGCGDAGRGRAALLRQAPAGRCRGSALQDPAAGRARQSHARRADRAVRPALLDVSQRVDRRLEDMGGGHVVNHPGTAGAAEILFDQRALHCDGGPALVPQQDGKAQIVHVAGEGAGGLGAGTVGAVQV
ncbi:hypothetical protein QU38_01400, partial [Staphylococcus aureus]